MSGDRPIGCPRIVAPRTYGLSFTRSLIPQQTSLFKCQGQGSKGEIGSVQGFPKPNLELEQGHLHRTPLDKARPPGNPYSRCRLIDSPSEWAEVQSHCPGHGSSSRQRQHTVCCSDDKTNPVGTKESRPTPDRWEVCKKPQLLLFSSCMRLHPSGCTPKLFLVIGWSCSLLPCLGRAPFLYYRRDR